MAISRTKKEEIIRGLHERFERARVVAFVQFKGLGVTAVSMLRRKLRSAGAEYVVAKKTLARHVMDGMGFAGNRPQMEGETAFVFGFADEIAPVRAVHELAKDAGEDKLAITGGLYQGEYRSKEVMRAFAVIPPRETLLGQIVGLSASPIRGTVNALGGVLRNAVMTLAAIAQAKS